MTRLTVLLTGLALLTTGCDNKLSRGGFPEPITSQGDNMLGVWRGSLITAICVGVFVIGLILGSALLFRRRSDDLPRQVRYNLPIEVLYTVVPMVIISVLFYFTAIRENDNDKYNSIKPDLTIGVVGFQWAWQFNYPAEGVSVTGRPGIEPTLVLPVDSNVLFVESSPDVVHAFWVIPFLFKRDVVPGRNNAFMVYLNKTGTFAGKCTEYCGTNHDRMLFTVKVVSQSEYQAWVAETKQAAQDGTDPTVTVFTGPTPQPSIPGKTYRSHQ